VIITTGRIRRTLVNKINLLVDSPISIEASRLALVKAESIFLRRATGCLDTWCGSSLVVDYFAYAARPGASARCAAHRLSSTTSPTPRDRVPRHVAQLVAWLVAPLFVNYFAYAARSSASARRVAHHEAHRRLLRAPRLRHAATLSLL
jgi:hypothetical protein